MTCEARQTPKGHTTVYLDGVLLATISGAGRTKEVRMRIARLIAASMDMCRYIPSDADLDSLNDHAKYMKKCGIYGGGVLSQIVENIKQFKQEAGLC